MSKNQIAPSPKYDLETYRQFIRDAAPFVSLIAGRKLTASDAETISDEQLLILAHEIDVRAEALKGKLANR